MIRNRLRRDQGSLSTISIAPDTAPTKNSGNIFYHVLALVLVVILGVMFVVSWKVPINKSLETMRFDSDLHGKYYTREEEMRPVPDVITPPNVSEDTGIILTGSNNSNDGKKNDKNDKKSNTLPVQAKKTKNRNDVFCKKCMFRPDNNTITCGEKLVQYKDANPQAAMDIVMSNGYRNCLFPKIKLLPLSEGYSATTCLEKRGLSGKWAQDIDFARRNYYPNHRPYTLTNWHIADSFFKPTPDEPFYSYNTYKWIDDQCPISELTLGGFCQVMYRLNLTQILIIGDSISMQFRKGLEAMLGFPFASLYTPRDWLDYDHKIIPCEDVEETPGFSFKIYMLPLKPYRDSVALHPQRNQTQVEQIFRDSASRLKDPIKLQRTISSSDSNVNKRKKWVESNPGKNRTLLVMNIGSWMESFSQYELSLRALFAWIDTLPKGKIVPFFRDTLPGHPECDPSGDRGKFDWSNYPLVRPYTNYQEFVQETQLKRSRPESNDWPEYWKYQSNGTFEHYNKWTKEVIAQRPSKLVNIHWLNVYNSSILRRDGLIGFSDCLHHNLPGPKDGEVHLLYSALLDMSQTKIVSKN